MKTYLEISISAIKTQRELLIPTMVELGCHGFMETDSELLAYIDKGRIGSGSPDLFIEDLKKILQTISANLPISVREIKEENWNYLWEQSIKPIEIGKKIVVKPTWQNYDNPSGRIIIEIDPKMSFGTGYHETTRLTLRLAEKYVKPGDTVLDVGTGTGILAIAAVKLGASRAYGIDIDKWSINNATENVILNGLENKIKITGEDIEEIAISDFDILMANLTFNTNVELLPHFYRHIKDSGYLFLSGLLEKDGEAMEYELSVKNFKVLETVNEKEWIAIVSEKTI